MRVKPLSGVELSIGVASNHVAQSDRAYHRQLDRIDYMTLRGWDTSTATRIGIGLKRVLDRDLAWLKFLQEMQEPA